MISMSIRSAVFVSSCLCVSSFALAQNPRYGGGPLNYHAGSCVSDTDIRSIRAAVANWRALHPESKSNDSSPPIYAFWPMGGNLHNDIFNGGFVDLDPTSPGYHNFDCQPFTYDTHAGIDCNIRSFAEQIIGIPVFAVADGTVVYAHDGEPDMNTFPQQVANIVSILHTGGRLSEYFHLKNGSLTVSVGQVVKAGTQIGKVASSGYSWGPHLHFQNSENNGSTIIETFAGPCRPGPSGWVNQTPLHNYDLYLTEFATTRDDLTNVPWLPNPLPRTAQFALSDPQINFWFIAHNFVTDCPFRIRFYKPDNSLAWTYDWHWGNPETWRIMSSWFGFDFQAMGPVTGTWHILFELNNQVMINAPFEVVNTINPNFNRPPEPISASLDPPSPSVNDVIFCRVNSSLVLEDLDYDIVRYHYVWKVNGNTVRNVTTAAQSDAIPHHLACSGALVQCTVTPNDGKIDGSAVIASAVVTGPKSPDINCDGHVNVTDLLAVINSWGPCPAPPASCPADIAPTPNGDGNVNVNDLLMIINNWG